MDPRVTEFHCIMPIANVASVMENGILSHEHAARLQHRSVAMPEIQERRDQKHVPGGLRLHQYANLYFHARNPMMYKRLGEIHQLCVLRISLDVRGVQGVVFADCNASTNYVRFLDPAQWRLLNFDDIYAMDWTHPDDPVRYKLHKARKCAEVLVPHRVDPARLLGGYVVNAAAAELLVQTGFQLPITVDPVLFFR